MIDNFNILEEKKMKREIFSKLCRDATIAHRRNHGIATIQLLKKGGTI
jgi:hypothetical protein